MTVTVVVAIALVYAGLAVVLYLLQTAIIFPGAPGLGRTPALNGWPYEAVALRVLGETTHGWYIPLENSRGTLLFSHGNAENISNSLDAVRLFREFGYSAFVYDYGGYGRSTGKPSEARCYADIRAAWRYLTEQRGVRAEDIVLFGRSLGGAVTAELAAEVRPRAVILESTFESATALGKKVLPFMPVGLLVRHRFDTASKVGRFTAPLLVIHGPRDEIVPYAHGRRLFELAPEPKAFLEMNGGHNDGPYATGKPYEDGLRAFLTPYE